MKGLTRVKMFNKALSSAFYNNISQFIKSNIFLSKYFTFLCLRYTIKP